MKPSWVALEWQNDLFDLAQQGEGTASQRAIAGSNLGTPNFFLMNFFELADETGAG